MINKLKQTAKNLWEKFVIHKYVSSGIYWGDLTSYAYMGEPYGYDSVCKSLDFWEAQYEKLGYLLIDREEWVAAGGYGKTEYKSQLKIKKIPELFVLKKIVCDETNNTQEDIDNQIVNVDIYGAIIKPINKINVNIVKIPPGNYDN